MLPADCSLETSKPPLANPGPSTSLTSQAVQHRAEARRISSPRPFWASILVERSSALAAPLHPVAYKEARRLRVGMMEGNTMALAASPTNSMARPVPPSGDLLSGSMGRRGESMFGRELQPRSVRLLAVASIASSDHLLQQSSTARRSGPRVTMGPGLDGALSRRTGFLSAFELPQSLPPTFAPWEEALRQLPTALRSGRARQAIHTLPCLAAEMHDVPDRFLSRASIVISTLLHAYAFEVRHREGGTALARRAPDLVAAWQMVSSRLDRPVLQRTPADDILNNTLLSGSTPRLGVEYFDLPEERLSAGVQVGMEHAFAPALEAMGSIQQYVVVEDDAGIAGELCNIMSAIIDCARVFLSTRCQHTTDGLDFVIWGRTYPEIGRALYPGALNNSGVSSPLFHALDAFVGVGDVDHELYRQQRQRRALLPLPVRLFIDALGDRRYCIRSYADDRTHPTVAAAFDAMIQTYAWLLGLHRMRAVGGIAIAEASGRQRTAGGMRSGGRDSLDEIINRQMTRSILARVGSRPPTLAATVVSISQCGRRSSCLTLEYAFALPARPGDRIQVWPERSSADGQHRPRHYSIADAETRGTLRRVTLTIAHSEGLCSLFLRGCVPGREIQTRLVPAPAFWSVDDSRLPLLLVAQGVGVGPFLGFLRQRRGVREGGGTVGKTVLVVGAEDVEDIPYFGELAGLTQALPLAVYCALSRTAKPVARAGRDVHLFGAVKTHDIMPQLQEQIRADVLFPGGHIFVCGSTSFGATTRSALQALHLVEAGRYHEDCFGGRRAGGTATTTITITELMRHNRPDDLWLAIDGVVYDVTALGSTHPGGLKTLVECAGMPADRRFSQIHGGDAGQGILAQMEQYAIGVVEFDADLSSPRMQAALRVVQAQNVLTNCTSFAPGRTYAFAESLIVVRDSTRRLRDSFGGERTTTAAAPLDGALDVFKEQGWHYLGEDPGPGVSGKDLERRIARRELRLRVAYSTVWEQFHGFFDRLKLSCVQYQQDDAGPAKAFDALWEDCASCIRESIHREVASLRRDIEEESASRSSRRDVGATVPTRSSIALRSARVSAA